MPAPDGVDRFYSRTCRAVVPARDAAAAVCHVYLRTLRAVRHHGRGTGGRYRPKTPLRYVAMAIWLYSAIRGLQLAWEHTMIQLHPSPFQTCDFAARFPTGCRWINGCRRFSLRPETVQYVSGSSCRWRCRNGWWGFSPPICWSLFW